MRQALPFCGVAARLNQRGGRYRARAVEAALRGHRLEAAAEKAVEGVDCTQDIHASAAYRGHLARVVTRRALSRALAGIEAGFKSGG